MYCDFFGLRCRPFEDRADTRFYHATADADEALAAMEYESHFGKGASLILGEAGTGKTLLVRTLLQQLHATDHVVVLTWTSDGPTDLIRETCRGFGVSVSTSGQSGRVMPRLRRHLQRTHHADHRSILIIDQVENLTSENVVQLSTLLNVQQDGQKLLNVILIGQPHFKEKLDGSELAGVRQHLYGERTLKALTLSDTQAYVEHRLRIAGAGDTTLFDSKAVAQIHRASGGVPRLINHMCEAALLAAYGAQETTIGESIAAEVVGQHAPKQQTKERSVAAELLGLGSSTDVATGWQGREEPFVVTETRKATAGGPILNPQAAEPIAESSEWTEPRADTSCTETTNIEAARPPEPPTADDVISISDQALARLERALDRAERMTATSDAAAARCAAVEKHLAKLMDGADSLTTTLTDSIQHASHSLDTVQGRLNRIFDDGDVRLSKISHRVAQVADATVETEEQADRLDRACQTGRQVEARLTQFAGELANRADDVQQHIAGLMGNVAANEEANVKLAEMIQQADRITIHTDEQLQTLKTALQQGEVEAQQLRERFTSDLVETAREKLEGLTKRATSTTRDADERMAQLRSIVEEAGQEASKVKKQLVESAVADYRQQLTDCLNSQIQAHMTAVKATLTTSRQTMAETTESLNQQVIDLEKRVDTARQATDETASVCEKSVTARITQADHGIRTMGRQIERLDKRHGDVEQALSALKSEVDSSITRVESLDGLMKEKAPAVDALTLKAEQAGAALIKTVSRAETLVNDTNEASAQIVTLQQTSSTTLIQLGDVCERLGEARVELRDSEETLGRLGAARGDVDRLIVRLEQAASSAQPIKQMAEKILPEATEHTRRLESQLAAAAEVHQQLDTSVDAGRVVVDQADAVRELAGRLNEVQSAGDTTVSQLQQILASAPPVLQSIQQTMSEATEQERRLESTRASITGVLDDLSHATADSRGLADGIAKEVRKAVEVSNCTAEHMARMEATRESGTRIVQELADLIESAGDIHNSLQGVVAHTDEEVHRLESHCTAATQTLGELSTGTLKGVAVATQLTEATESVRKIGSETIARIDRGIREVWDINTRTDVNLKTLTTKHEQAVEVTKALTDVLEPAGATLTDITKRSEDARVLASSMEEQIDNAVRLSDRIQSLSTLLENVQHAEESVKATAMAAKETCSELVGAAEEAATQCGSLTDLGAHTQGLIETHEQIRQEAESVVERLTGQLTTGQKAARAAQPLLEDFIAQSREIDDHLREAKRESQRIEDSVMQSTKRPAELVAAAQRQAAELERVCDAVRKVFSGLSKASLEARNDTDEFQKIGQEAQERFAQIITDADGATATLEEWVKEAVLAQTRLARTLEGAPTIRETHPPGATQSDLRGRRMGTPGATGELKVLRTPEVTPAAEPKPQGNTTNRAETIAQLIEDAKKASVVESV